MEQNSKYIDEVEKLVEDYGFPVSTNEMDKRILIAVLSETLNTFKKNEVSPSIHSYSTFHEFRKFVKFLARCKDSTITMTGTITDPKGDAVRGTTMKVEFNNVAFINNLQAIADFEADRYERFVNHNSITIEIAGLKGNSLLGFYAFELIGLLNSFDLGIATDTKKYNFIYDALLLIGISGGRSIMDSGEKVREKYQAVRNWINAYKCHKNQQKG